MAILYIVLGTIAVLFALDAYCRRAAHPNEPVRVRPAIPLIGHLLGLATYGASYFTSISQHRSEEIYTLCIFNLRMYIVNSRRLIPLVQKSAKTLSFMPFQKIAIDVYVEPSKDLLDLYDGEHVHEFNRVQKQSLAPGAGLDYQNMRTAETIIEELGKLLKVVDEEGEKGYKLELYEWIQHAVTIAATDGVYGTANPFRDAAVEKGFWNWHKALIVQMARIPRIFIKDSIKGRDVLIEAFRQYFQGDHTDAADVIHARERISKKDGVNLDDLARVQASFNIALLGNSASTTFWTVYNIFSRPDLLKDIRHELESTVLTQSKDEDGRLICELDVSKLKTQCPLLLSTLEETQRTRSIHANVREVLEDTLLDGKYWLKKGSYLQIPVASVHKHQEVWGDGAQDFDPRRFLEDRMSIGRASLPTSYAFLAWGTAPSLCPARQFASTKVLVFVALMVMSVDMEQIAPAPDSNGDWKTPKLVRTDLVVMLPPKEKVQVRIRKRKVGEGLWKLKMGESKTRVPLASG